MSDQIEGRQPVREALRARRRSIHELWIGEGINERDISDIQEAARSNSIPIRTVPKLELDRQAKGSVHQGVIALCDPYPYIEPHDILARAAERGEAPFIVVAAHIQDPQNLGAIIRTAEVAGVHGLVLPKRRTALVTPAVVKASAGATEHMLITMVPNLVRLMKEWMEQRLWIYGADAAGSSVYQTSLEGPVVLCLGSEGEGLPRLLRETCDELVSIPMSGQLNSLNVSNAAAVIIYEIVRKRLQKR